MGFTQCDSSPASDDVDTRSWTGHAVEGGCACARSPTQRRKITDDNSPVGEPQVSDLGPGKVREDGDNGDAEASSKNTPCPERGKYQAYTIMVREYMTHSDQLRIERM
jgi:hypothetical protein